MFIISGFLVKGESFVVPFYVATSVSFVGALVASISRFVKSNVQKEVNSISNIKNNNNNNNNNNNSNNESNTNNNKDDINKDSNNVDQDLKSSPVLQFLITVV